MILCKYTCETEGFFFWTCLSHKTSKNCQKLTFIPPWAYLTKSSTRQKTQFEQEQEHQNKSETEV